MAPPCYWVLVTFERTGGVYGSTCSRGRCGAWSLRGFGVDSASRVPAEWRPGRRGVASAVRRHVSVLSIGTHRRQEGSMHYWPLVVPLVGAALLAVALNVPVGALLGSACGIALVGAVVSAVHHAEVVAHRVGEPFGTLVLALAVTAIESSLIVSVMLAGGEAKAALARDTIYATVMIIANGVVGACVLLGALRHREQAFRIEGAGPALAALATLATLVLVMPAFTVSAEGPRYTPSQLGFVAVSSLTMWSVFVFFQTVRHRDYFLPPHAAGNDAVHAAPPTAGEAWMSFALLLVALVAVVGLAKVLSPSIESAVRNAGAPPAVVGIAIAL